ncbi:restriction endonuclease [Sandaracinus amylolyticus]|uniref:restriction endonuclease n=1 Tax=Sandaracinus amylolyticus TaxID=927083 RepID=UPI001F471E9F|nr:restriction endonuclease [Sandaracinus amylolyticus]UJR78523.1 Restriction endonuclease [Sandaracinus amylolyticus]
MALPTYDQLIEPLLRFLATRPDGVRVSEARDAIATQLAISTDDRAVMLPSRQQPIYDNRVGWAHDRLKRAGLSTSARRGFWVLTERGHKYVKAHPAPLSREDVEDLAEVERGNRLRDREPSVADSIAPEPGASRRSPDERIEEAITELNQAVARELLELIGEAPPEFFEVLVLDLLHALGYGTSRSDLQRVGRSGDGGIDGIIALDRLGLEKVYVQAKRWQNNVGRPDVQAFFGALAGRRAKKGVFITTAGYTREAREFAETVSDSIVLVDGARLTTLMIEHGVGVTHKAVRVAHVDSDYFEDV